MRRSAIRISIAAVIVVCMAAGHVRAAGVMTPRQRGGKPIEIRDHHVNVTINNGYAVTEVNQTFYNPNTQPLEAIYSFPLPKSASLSEVTIFMGEDEIRGEVLPKDKARRAYNEERDSGNNAGLAEKNGYSTFDFAVSPVRPRAETRIRFLYYQPIKVEMGVGRYVYPLQENMNDAQSSSFWGANDQVENTFSVNVDLKSAYPVARVRTPGFESAAVVDQKGEGHYVLKVEQQKTRLNKDFVFYYRLQDNLPGRVELVAYRPNPRRPGTFMLVVTPGMDLGKIEHGSDYTFVLDVSGSMSGKLRSLTQGVAKAIDGMKPHDRFRIITFNDRARELTRGLTPATSKNVQQYVQKVRSLRHGGGTNLFAGLKLALRRLDDDRATSLIIVTDGVTNTGVTDHAAFERLMKEYDIRAFGFIMGNSANWPLMRTICNATGGYLAGVSNNDDIVGQIALAKSKIVYECMHDAELTVRGVKAAALTGKRIGKVYRGEQLVMFGRYTKPGLARVALRGRMTGQDRTYTTDFDFPEVATDHPELERLWALNRIEDVDALASVGRLGRSEADGEIRRLGVEYQLVTDETSMVVLSNRTFARRGIERRNAQRIAVEQQARSKQAAPSPTQQPATQKPPQNQQQRPVHTAKASQRKRMFHRHAPSFGGGGALDPFSVGIAIALAGLAASSMRRRKEDSEQT